MNCPTCRGQGTVYDEDLGLSICWQCRGTKVAQPPVPVPDPPVPSERLRFFANDPNQSAEIRSMANELLDLRYLLRRY